MRKENKYARCRPSAISLQKNLPNHLTAAGFCDVYQRRSGFKRLEMLRVKPSEVLVLAFPFQRWQVGLADGADEDFFAVRKLKYSW